MNRWFLLVFLVLLFPILYSVNKDSELTIKESICTLVNSVKSLVAIVLLFMSIITIPVLITGIFLYLKKPKWKKIGSIILIAIVALDLILVIVYLFIPAILGAITGLDLSDGCRMYLNIK